MFCPNINDNDYKQQSSILGDAVAHYTWDANGGQPLRLNPDGTNSKEFEQWSDEHGFDQAMRMRAVMMSEGYQLSDGATIQPVVKITETSALVGQLIENNQSGRTFDMLLRNMEKAFPGLNIIRENSDSAARNGKRNQSGWVNKEGVHVNLDNISYQMPVHEMAHVFLHLLERYSPQVWESINKELDTLIENNSEYNRLAAANPSMDEESLRREYLAMVAGYVSENKVRRFMQSEGATVTPEVSRNLFQRTRDFFNKIWNAIGRFLGGHYQSETLMAINLGNVDMETLFDAFTNDILAGRTIMNMNYDEQQMIMSKYTNDTYEAFHELTDPVTMVQTTGDLPNILMNSEDRNVLGNTGDAYRKNPQLFADMMYQKMYKVEGDPGLHLDWMGRKFHYPTMSETGIKNLLKSEVLDHHCKTINDFPMHLEKILVAFSEKNANLEDIINKEFETKEGNIKIRVNEMMRLVELMGGHDLVKRVVRLSDLAKEPKFAGMFDTALIGMNPIVIVHDDTDMLDISISDVTMGEMGFASMSNTDNNKLLSSRFRNDYNTLGSDVKMSWTNSKKDVRRAALTLSLAGINHLARMNNLKLKVRRAGVYGMRGGMRGSVDIGTIFNFDEAFAQVRHVLRLSGMSSLIDNNLIRNIIADDQAWQTDNMQVSHLQELISYYHTERSEQRISDAFRDKLLGKDMSSDEHIRILRQRMRVIEFNAKSREDALNDVEYQTLAKAVLYLKSRLHVNNMNLRDIDSMLKNVTNAHNMNNDLAQYASTQFEAAKSVVLNEVYRFNSKFIDLIEKVKEARNVYGSNAETIFENMFPEVTVIADRDYAENKWHKAVKSGEKVQVKLYNTIISHSFVPTKGMIVNPNITEAEKNLGDFILQTVKDKYINEHYNRNRRYHTEYDIEESEKWFNDAYTKGTIPVIAANMNQQRRAGDVKQFTKNFFNMMAHGDLQYADMASSKFHDITSTFISQVNESRQLQDMGISKQNNPNDATKPIYVSTNLDATFMQSNNLEYTVKLFELDMTREVVFNNEVLPVYNELIAIANHVRNTTKNELINTRDWIRQYTNLILYRQRQDDVETGGTTATFSPIVRTSLQLNTFLNLGYRPIIWAKSAFFNEQNIIIGSLATQMSNIGVDEENRIFMPTVTDMMKAHQVTITEFKKVWELAKKMQIVNGTERDVMENLVNNITDKSPFKQQIAHWGNWATDVACRSLSMAAHMIHDGSYDAHIYNPETGELSYDITKDLRFYDEQGKKREGWDVVAKTIYDNQKQQGLLEEGKQIIGYEFEEINGRIKWYADKFLIGSMDNYQKTLLGNTWFGAAMGQFRSFSWDKIWNTFGGLVEGGHQSQYGMRFKPVKDENGEWITVKDQQLMEGMLRSLVEMTRETFKMKGLTKEQWNQMPPMRRRNVMELLIRSTMFAAFAAVIGGLLFDDDDDKKKKKGLSTADKRKLEFMFSDLMAIDSISSLYSNPVPIFRLLVDVWDMVIGEHRIQKMVRYVGPLNDTIWLWELATPNDKVFRQKSVKQIRKEHEEDLTQKELKKLRSETFFMPTQDDETQE